ncbi:MAG: hypothetical protein KC619_08110 [Myxococcales bacterium]|nr:hypothetical protein [Myxococcales bacterium]
MTDRHLELVWDAESATTPFEVLIAAAGRDPEAAAGLALAYADMPAPAREKLVESIASSPNALLLLLGVERDPELARKIAEALQASAAQPSEDRDVAFAWGDGQHGGVGIVRHLHGDFVDTLRVSWTPTDVEAQVLPIGRADDIEALRTRAAVPDDARRVPREIAVDAMTEALWRHHRAGRAIPPDVQPFAELFSPTRRP